MQFDKESNGFIVTFLVIMVLIVGLALSLVTSALQPLKQKNEIVDKKSKILKSVIIVDEEKEEEMFTPEFVLNEYEENIDEIVVNHQGEPIEGLSAFNVDFRKELKKPVEERAYPVYVYSSESGNYYIIPLNGMGLWDEISGYMALKSDFNTVVGATFDHKGETPGLGARITEKWFREQFQGKKLFDEDGELAIRILKGENNPQVDGNPHLVDGISGATITAEGADKMIGKCVRLYDNYFTQKAKS